MDYPPQRLLSTKPFEMQGVSEAEASSHLQPRTNATIATSGTHSTNHDDRSYLAAIPVNRLNVLEAEPLPVGNGTVSEPMARPAGPTLMGVPLMIVPAPPLLKVTPPIAINPSPSTVKVWPSVVIIVGVGVSRGIVLVPITREPPGPTLMGVPLMIVPAPPLLKVVPPIAINPPPFTVNVWPSVVMTVGVGVSRGIVLVPMTREPEGLSEMSVLLIIIPGPPADKVAPATENLVGFAVKVWPPTVKVDDCEAPEIVVVVPPTTNSPNGPRLTVVPATSTAGPPALTVVPDPTRSAPFAVSVWPPTVTTAASGEGVLVVPPITRSPAAPILTGVPETVTAGAPAITGVPAI